MAEGTLGKQDASPVTVGDFAVQARSARPARPLLPAPLLPLPPLARSLALSHFPLPPFSLRVRFSRPCLPLLLALSLTLPRLVALARSPPPPSCLSSLYITPHPLSHFIPCSPFPRNCLLHFSATSSLSLLATMPLYPHSLPWVWIAMFLLRHHHHPSPSPSSSSSSLLLPPPLEVALPCSKWLEPVLQTSLALFSRPPSPVPSPFPLPLRLAPTVRRRLAP